jgi:hypothetical protein
MLMMSYRVAAKTNSVQSPRKKGPNFLKIEHLPVKSNGKKKTKAPANPASPPSNVTPKKSLIPLKMGSID